MTFRPWRDAWTDALYGPDGFFVTRRPVDHFATAANSSPLLAEALLTLARREGLTHVVDVGSGGGELLRTLLALAPDLTLTGVDLGPRPANLPAEIAWRSDIPTFRGLLVAHEWLDNVPTDVVELDNEGRARLVEVEPDGTERLGAETDLRWLDAWWPLTEPGQRAEDGSTRDDAWADAVAKVDGLAVAIDYGHLRETRPPFGSLDSFQDGIQVDIRPDGTRDVTAHVAVDSLVARTGGRLLRQRDALRELGVDGSRPPLGLATTDPAAYLTALARASDAARLTAPGGWGDFWWVVTRVRSGSPVSD